MIRSDFNKKYAFQTAFQTAMQASTAVSRMIKDSPEAPKELAQRLNEKKPGKCVALNKVTENLLIELVVAP